MPVEETTTKSRVVKHDQGDHVLIRIERPPNTGRPRYETFELDRKEAEQVKYALELWFDNL
jgi:hypothetical protein